ncbi:MAG TPA: hypothetical protein PKB09_02365 [Candidatus Saccharibacteria bacterium]|nr:hypothetical protein [Candidatus Saccharibacteria bacterium]
MGVEELPEFSTGAYTQELVELSRITDQIPDEALKEELVERVNRMQLMLQPVIDSYLHHNTEARSTPLTMEDLMGPAGLG